MADERIRELEEQLRDLRTWRDNMASPPPPIPQPAPVINIKVPSSKKIRSFSGKTDENVSDWIEDAKGVVLGMDDREAARFLLRNLEGPAREEVKFLPAAVRENPTEILSVLDASFGDKLNAVQLRRKLYARTQLDRESVRDYSRALLEIMDRLCKKDARVESDRDRILCELLSENVKDKFLRRELKKAVREEEDISFIDLRSIAVRWEEEDMDRNKASRATVGEIETQVEESVSVSAEPVQVQDSPFSVLARQIADLAATQTQLLTTLQQGLRATPDTRRSRACYACGQIGHFRRNCPLNWAEQRAAQVWEFPQIMTSSRITLRCKHGCRLYCATDSTKPIN